MNQPALTRREILKTAALGAFTLPLFGSVAFAAEKKNAEKAAPAVLPSYATFPDGREHGLRLGVTSYSTRSLTLDETIATMKVVRISNLALYKAHCNWESASVDECRAIGEKLKAGGFRLTGSGVINLSNDEAKTRQAFENAKAGGMATMVCKPAKDALRLVEQLAKEFDQKLAIHNHGPEDKEYPSPAVAFEAIKSLDSRIGLCIDVGHTARFGEDPIAAIKKYASRVYDVHMKDSVAIVGAQKDVPIEVGAGRLDIRGLLRVLLEVKYNGVVTFEYEKVAGNPVTGLAESLGYVRGMLAALAA
ncbi:MAG: sugar phosphate isomerase/epimerase [Opitutus sp.]|nr:sugar phosphate isomerase/epimerase [Opitutus sp.]